MSKNTPPAYRLHKARNCAVVTIRGRNHYLGPFGSTESRERYARLLLAEWQEQPVPPLAQASKPATPNPLLTIDELILQYWLHVKNYYVKNGRPTSEQDNIRQALRFLRRLFGSSQATAFGPRSLEEVRNSMVVADRCRRLVNEDIKRIRRMFRWATARELMDVAVFQSLATLEPLRKGRTAARESPPVKPVPMNVVEKTLPFLSPTLQTMVRLQLLTGARPGEICSVRPVDVDRISDPWLYRPSSHKTEHHDRERRIYLGPRAQELLEPFLNREPEECCFCPSEVVAIWRAQKRLARRSPMTPSQQARQAKVDARRIAGDRYAKDSYRRAIQRAARKAGVEIWSPNRLRHTRATELRARFGRDGAQVVLGHSDPKTTEIYAERDFAKAATIMSEAG